MSSKTKTKTTNTPYDPAAIKAGQNALNTGYGQAQNTIAQNSPALQGAINQINQNIATPPQYSVDARANLDKTINGDYLDPASNPYSSGMAKLIGDRTAGNYAATFGASGRSHGGLAALLSSQGTGDALNNFYGNIYNQERGLQQNATLAAPAFNQDEYTGIDHLFPAVANTATLPLNAANSYASGIGNLIQPYSTQTTTQKQGFGLQQALGLAGMVAGAAMGNPMAMSAGGGGGGLAGLMAQPMSTSFGSPSIMPSAPGGFSSSLGYLPGFGG